MRMWRSYQSTLQARRTVPFAPRCLVPSAAECSPLSRQGAGRFAPRCWCFAAKCWTLSRQSARCFAARCGSLRGAALRRQLEARCSVSSKHVAASAQSTLPRQFQARCRVSSKHVTASVQSTLQRQFKAPCSGSSKHPAATSAKHAAPPARRSCGKDLKVLPHDGREPDKQRSRNDCVSNRHFVQKRQRSEHHQVGKIEIVARIHTETE
jgi:hypothetical protein